MRESPDRTLPRTDRINEAKRGHRECMEVLEELERSVDRKPDEDWVVDLTQRLPSLRDALDSHFRDEEEGSLYSKMPLTYPHLSARFDTLKSEHPKLLRHVDDIMDKARSLTSHEPYELRELDAHVQLLLARIRRHEAQENELVFEAVWHEVGVSG